MNESTWVIPENARAKAGSLNVSQEISHRMNPRDRTVTLGRLGESEGSVGEKTGSEVERIERL